MSRSGLLHQRAAVVAGGDGGADRGLATLLPLAPDVDQQAEEPDVDDDDADVAHRLPRNGDRVERAADRRRLEDVERAVDDVRGAPAELGIRVSDPAIR